MDVSDPASEVPAEEPAQRPPVAPRAVRVLSLLGVLVVLVWLGQHGARQIYHERPDFEYFYKSGIWLLHHGVLDPGWDTVNGHIEQRGTLEWYLPCVPRMMTLVALLPFRPAGYVWLGLNLLALLVTLRLLGRHLTGLPPKDWPVTQLLPLIILAAYWRWEFRLNQIDNFTLLLIVLFFVTWQQGRRVASGFSLGLAVLLKLTPALLVLWLLLKRQYRTVGVTVLTVLLAGPLADMAALGPEYAIGAYRQWVERCVAHGSHRGLILAQSEMDWRNQGLGAVTSRWLHETNYNTHFDNDPRHQAEHGTHEVRTLNVVNLPLNVVAYLATGVALLSLAGLIWLCRRPAALLTVWQVRFEWTLFMLAMLWLMPVMRLYHMVWALPAISILGAGVHYAGMKRGWSMLALVCLGLALVAQLSLFSIDMSARGTVLGTVVVLAVPIVVMLLSLRRSPRALPPPYHVPPRSGWSQSRLMFAERGQQATGNHG